MRNIGRLLRRRDHPAWVAVCGGGFNCGGEHRGLACAGCALHGDERVDGCHGGGRSRLRRVEPVPVRDVRQAWRSPTRLCGCCEEVAQPGLGGDHVQTREVRDVLGMRAVGRQDRQAILRGQPGRERDELAQRRRVGAHAGLRDDAGDVRPRRRAPADLDGTPSPPPRRNLPLTRENPR